MKTTHLALASARGAAHARCEPIAGKLHRGCAIAERRLATARDRRDRVLIPRSARQHAVDDQCRRKALFRLLNNRAWKERERRRTVTFAQTWPKPMLTSRPRAYGIRNIMPIAAYGAADSTISAATPV